jgi:hypothetical protein
MMARFCRYLEKLFDWSGQLALVRDNRPRPQIPTAAVVTSALLMAATRLRSLNALESELRRGGRWERLVGRRKPSADSLGRIVGRIDPEALRALLSWINHRLRRKKILADNPWALRVATFDGHEFFSQ